MTTSTASSPPPAPVAAAPISRTPPFTPAMARDMSEATLQSNILGLAVESLGWLAYHTHDSRRSQPGFPDLVLAHGRQQRLIFAELKTERGRQTNEQKLWEGHLRVIRSVVALEFYLWRPTDWLSGAIARILQRRPA